MDLEALESLGLARTRLLPGEELDEDELGLLALAAEIREAREAALSLLARAEQSSFLLRGKLLARGLSKRAIDLALEALREKRLLDDARYARAYASSRLAHRGSRAEGPATLIAALRERGIERETAAAAIDEVLPPEERVAAVAKAAARLEKRIGKDRDELRRALRELGFKSEELDAYFEGESL